MPGLRQAQTDNWRELVFNNELKSDQADDIIIWKRQGELLSLNLCLNNLDCKNYIIYLIKKK